MAEKILLMSDIHITEPGTQIIGLDPAARFRRCLAHAAEHHADAAHLFLMGDLTHHGQVSQYKILKQCLEDQPFPATLMLGNHDRRRAFAEVFPECEAGFRNAVIALVTLTCCISTRWMSKPKTGTADAYAQTVSIG